MNTVPDGGEVASSDEVSRFTHPTRGSGRE